jgi:hypothetical protein
VRLATVKVAIALGTLVATFVVVGQTRGGAISISARKEAATARLGLHVDLSEYCWGDPGLAGGPSVRIDECPSRQPGDDVAWPDDFQRFFSSRYTASVLHQNTGAGTGTGSGPVGGPGGQPANLHWQPEAAQSSIIGFLFLAGVVPAPAAYLLGLFRPPRDASGHLG